MEQEQADRGASLVLALLWAAGALVLGILLALLTLWILF